MENTVRDERLIQAIEEFTDDYRDCEILEFDRDYQQRDSLSENFVNEIEAWARHALAANGFGDHL
jgi:hypothetical protein